MAAFDTVDVPLIVASVGLNSPATVTDDAHPLDGERHVLGVRRVVRLVLLVPSVAFTVTASLVFSRMFPLAVVVGSGVDNVTSVGSAEGALGSTSPATRKVPLPSMPPVVIPAMVSV